MKVCDILNVFIPILTFFGGVIATCAVAVWYEETYLPWKEKRQEAKRKEEEYRRKVEALYKALDKPIYLDSKELWKNNK